MMPKDGIQSFGQLLVDQPCLKREIEKNTSEFVNNSVIESAIWLQIHMVKTFFSKLTIDDSLKKLYQNTCRKSIRYQRTTCS